MRVYKCPRLATNGVRCCVFACAAALVRFYMRMLNHLASLAASDSLICADSFVIGVLDDECGGGGAPLDSTPTQNGGGERIGIFTVRYGGVDGVERTRTSLKSPKD